MLNHAGRLFGRLTRWARWPWVLMGVLMVLGGAMSSLAGNVSSTIDDVNGRIGIGTADPMKKLSVSGAGGSLLVENMVGLAATGPVVSMAVDGYSAFEGTFRFEDKRATQFFPSFVWNVASDNYATVLAYDFQGSGTSRLAIRQNGNVGIGIASPESKLHVNGNVKVEGNIGAKYQDVAEWVPASGPLFAGTVVVIDPAEGTRVAPASRSYDSRVAGVVSSRPGILLGEAGENKVKVAHSGRVRVKVDARYGPVAVGDLLVTSPTEGHAMRSTPLDFGGTPLHRPGTLLGKALEPLEKGQGEILVILVLQ